MPGALQRGEDRHLDDVDADRLAGQPVLGELGGDLAGDLLGDAGVGWKAPRSVEMPARARSSPSSHGL